jgi:hypothetical protein
MRVRINYAVDSEDLPAEIHMLTSRASSLANTIDAAVTEINSSVSTHDLTPDQIDMILDTRDNLVKLDSYLADAAQTMLAYQQIKLQETAARGDLDNSESIDSEHTHNGGEYEQLLQRTGEISESIDQIEFEE